MNVRKWSVRELDAIEYDLSLAVDTVRQDYRINPNNPRSFLKSAADCEWLAERIEIRAQHGIRMTERCDGCRNDAKTSTTAIVDEYRDEMGAPSNLGVSYLCNYHIRNDY
jgi:hypothetical protein